MEDLKFVAPCLFGVESIAAGELTRLDIKNVKAENGRVLFEGDYNTLARANICSRYLERICINVGEFEATSFEELFEGVKKLPWERFIGKKDAFPVNGYSLNSALFSIPDCQSIIKKAIVERLKSKYQISWFDETGAELKIRFSILKNMVTMMIDTSGEGLHKRGYRPASNAAPIKETLAAALCYFARLRDFHTLYDPMCGSGTILTEGAMMVKNIAPGINRRFTAEQWKQIPPEVWKEERERAKSLEKPEIPFKAYGSDVDDYALRIALDNAKRAGVADYITFTKGDATQFTPKTERGTVIVNPPYGERLMDTKSVQELYGKLGKAFAPQRGWSYYVITADEDFEKAFGRKADKRRKLYNGMIKCQLYMYYK